MNELRPREMTKEELEKILDEYREKNVQLENELDTYKTQLAMAISREDMYRESIANLSAALKNLAEAVA